jgi:hypothetical protein
LDARTAIALFLRREAKYDQAIRGGAPTQERVSARFLFCLEEANLRKDAGEGMRAVDAYRQIQADNAKPGYFAEARMELADFGLGDAERGQRHDDEAAQAYEQAAATPGAGLELKIRSLLDAGECRDMSRATPACDSRLPGGDRRGAQYLARRPGSKVPPRTVQGKLELRD